MKMRVKTMGKKIAVVGSRDYKNLHRVRDVINMLPPDTIIVSGGARGVDSAAEHWAKARNLQVRIFMADWKQHGKRAGFLRNMDIEHEADECIAFWDGRSKGTMHTVGLFRKAGKPVRIIKDTNEKGTQIVPSIER
jgi:hypothetical protein